LERRLPLVVGGGGGASVAAVQLEEIWWGYNTTVFYLLSKSCHLNEGEVPSYEHLLFGGQWSLL
jgi:hypothetical protein